MFWQYLRINSGFISGFRLSCAYCWGATWIREQGYEEEGTPPQKNFIPENDRWGQCPPFCGQMH